MAIFDWLFGKKTQHLIRENGVCEIYSDDSTIWKKFNLSNGLLDGKYESYTIHGSVYLTMNFKQGKLHGESSMFSPSRNCFEYIEKFEDGILVSSQGIRKIDGYDPTTLMGSKYELGPVEVDEKILQNKGSSIKKLDLEPEGYDGEIDQLRNVGVKFKLLTD